MKSVRKNSKMHKNKEKQATYSPSLPSASLAMLGDSPVSRTRQPPRLVLSMLGDSPVASLRNSPVASLRDSSSPHSSSTLGDSPASAARHSPCSGTRRSPRLASLRDSSSPCSGTRRSPGLASLRDSSSPRSGTRLSLGLSTRQSLGFAALQTASVANSCDSSRFGTCSFGASSRLYATTRASGTTTRHIPAHPASSPTPALALILWRDDSSRIQTN